MTVAPHLAIPFQPVQHSPGTPSRSRWRRLAWLGVLVAGVAIYLVELQVMISTQNVLYFPSLLLVGSITVPAATLVFAVTGGRRLMTTSSGLLVVAAVVGGLVGTLAAGVLEYDTLRSLSVLPMVLVAVIEESAKIVVPVVILLGATLLGTRRRDPREGVLVGIASGMGFATLETMGYGFHALLSAHSLAAVDTTLLLRAVTSPAGHIAWTGMTVAMLWRIPGAAHRGRAFAGFGAVFALAVVLHTAWDSVSSPVAGVVVAVVGLIALIVFIHRAHRPVPSRHLLGVGSTGPVRGVDPVIDTAARTAQIDAAFVAESDAVFVAESRTPSDQDPRPGW